jgi:hypothetical protein
VGGIELLDTTDEAIELAADNDLLRPEDAVSVDFLLAPVDSSVWSLFEAENGGNGRVRSISAGISATPIATSAMLPKIAVAPPVTGSMGPSSKSYSRGRYLDITVNESLHS